MRIDSIYISGWRKDLRFTEVCVASIRHWYPCIRLCLIKDELAGPYDTRILERRYKVEIYPSQPALYGWGAAKLEPLFHPPGERCLILDSDIVFTGRVLDHLERYDADFLVNFEDHEPDETVLNYFDPARIEQLVPGFRYPGFVFNTGQLVATTGLLHRSDFEPYLSFERPARFHRPDLFQCGEQGLLNFVLQAQQQAGALTLERVQFMHWAPLVDPAEVEVARLGPRSPYDFLLHWAGWKGDYASLGDAPLGHVLLHFEALYRRRTAYQRFRQRVVDRLGL